MDKYIMDIETNGFLKDVTKVHCMVIKNLTTGEVTSYRGDGAHDEFQSGLEYLRYIAVQGYLIGHNIIKFDLPVLSKLYGFTLVNQEKVIDTLVLSRLIYSDLKNSDEAYRKTGRLPSKLYASHSLKAWGYRLGILKGDLGEEETRFDNYTPEMLEYCKQDVEVTGVLFKHLEGIEYAQEAKDLEHKVAWICAAMERTGWKFDEAKAAQLYAKLVKEKVDIFNTMQATFEPITVDRGVSEKTGKKLKDKVVEFNPASRQHIAKRLGDKYGWKPIDFTPSGQAKIDDEVLSKLDYPEAKLLAEYFLLNKRLGQLAEGDQAWLKLVHKGRIHGSINTNGAVTGRCTHQAPNMAQVPSLSSKYGKECRELFIVPEKYKLVGVDLSGLELRCLAHFMGRWDNGAYGKVVVEGKQEDDTDIHTVNQRAAGLPTRAAAKTFIYALLYGAGDAKIGSIIGKGSKAGSELKKQFFNKIVALAKLRDTVVYKAKRGFLYGLDQRQLNVRSTHAALNTLLQSAGALVAKRWLIEVDIECKARGLVYDKDYALLGFIHDETQWQVKEELADEFGKLVVECAKRSGKYFKFTVPTDAQYSIGNNWADTH